MPQPAGTRIAYLCLQATREGQAAHAHVHEIVAGLEARGCVVQLFEPQYPEGPLPGAVRRALEFARIQLNLRRAARDADVVYIRAHFAAYPTARWAHKAGIPVVQEVNGPYEDLWVAWPWTGRFKRPFEALMRYQYRAADALIAVTPKLAEWIIGQTGRKQVTVVPNAANTSVFTPDATPMEGLPAKYVAFFGALAAWQGVDTMLAAAAHEDWPDDVSLVVMGDGVHRGNVEATVALNPRVKYLGVMPYREVPRVVVGSIAGLSPKAGMPRVMDYASPLKPFETLACGVPVIVTDFPGQADLIRECDCGLVIPPDDPAALARAVAELAADPERAAAMGRRGRETVVANHSWDKRAADTFEVIQQASHAKRYAAGAASDAAVASATVPHRHIAYLSLQAVVEGQDTWAAVMETVRGFEAAGWTVDLHCPDYGTDQMPSAIKRLWLTSWVQLHLLSRLKQYESLYVRAHVLAWPTSTIARLAGIPVVQECNGPYEDLFIAWPRTRIGRPIFEGLQRSQYRHASAVISVAQGLTEWLIADTGNPRVVTNGNGANVDVFTPDAPRRPGLPNEFAVFFGQFPAWQGIRTLLEAVRMPEWPNGLKLVFVGDGALRPEIESVVAEMPERVIYVGRLPYEEVAHVVAHAVVSYVPMVAPKREAKFSPLKLYESMACGVPVIASDTIGISEVVNATQCGVLITPGDATEMVAATNRLFANRDLAAEMGRRGRDAAVADFSWRARANQRREIIEAVIEGEPIEPTLLADR